MSGSSQLPGLCVEVVHCAGLLLLLLLCNMLIHPQNGEQQH
jgi:hypothetical protein